MRVVETGFTFYPWLFLEVIFSQDDADAGGWRTCSACGLAVWCATKQRLTPPYRKLIMAGYRLSFNLMSSPPNALIQSSFPGRRLLVHGPKSIKFEMPEQAPTEELKKLSGKSQSHTADYSL